LPRIEFEAETEDELLALAWRWVMGPAPHRGAPVAHGDDQVDLHRRQLVEVLNAIRGSDSRRFVLEVAELSRAGAALVLDEALKQRYGKQTGTAFAGIVAGPNKVMRRVARRDLIIWDGSAGGYRMDPAHAEIVLRHWAEQEGDRAVGEVGQGGDGAREAGGARAEDSDGAHN
jgi:hypothetical protein